MSPREIEGSILSRDADVARQFPERQEPAAKVQDTANNYKESPQAD